MRNALLMLMLLYAGVGNATDELMETSPCTGLVSSYDTETFARLLVVTDADFASIEDCEQLGDFYSESRLLSDYPVNYSRLAAIVDETWQPVNEEPPFMLLEAILAWMKRIGFEEHAESVREFVNEYMPARESVRFFFAIVIGLIVIGTLAVVVREFYLAGMLRIPRFRSHLDDSITPDNEPVMQWEAILALPLREQISALLHYSIDHLASSSLIPSSSCYTNRELVAYLERSDAHKASLLREQIDMTEPVLYGDERVTEERVIACRDRTRDLRDA
jgi:hypothetical protein